MQSIAKQPDEATDSLSLAVGDYILIGVNRNGSASTSKKHYVGTVQSVDEDNLHVMFMTSKGSLLNIHNLYPIFGRIIFVTYVFFCFIINELLSVFPYSENILGAGQNFKVFKS